MRRRNAIELGLGSEIVQYLIPHRPPFLLVDTIQAFAGEPAPTLWASKHIGACEPIFEGHFPGMHLWPGMYTIEGLGQTCNLLYVLLEVQRIAVEGELGDPFDSLRNLHLGHRMHPGFKPDGSARFLEVMGQHPRGPGVSAAVDMKLTRSVWSGQVVEYRVCLKHIVGDMGRFEVEATVEGHSVAKGTMTSHRGPVDLPGA